jgi:spermidine/putrescine transport system ATP-binding protein
MQLELKRLQRQVGTTFIFVTHDQEEALTLSDRIALIHEGRVVQCGSGHEIYHRPATEFAAEFIGHANIFEAELIGTDDGAVKIRLEGGLELRIRADDWPAAQPRAKVSIRAEKIRVSRSRVAAENGFEAHVEQQVFKGAIDRLLLVSTSGTRLTAIAMNEGALQPSQQRTDQVWCAIDPADVFVIE